MRLVNMGTPSPGTRIAVCLERAPLRTRGVRSIDRLNSQTRTAADQSGCVSRESDCSVVHGGFAAAQNRACSAVGIENPDICGGSCILCRMYDDQASPGGLDVVRV